MALLAQTHGTVGPVDAAQAMSHADLHGVGGLQSVHKGIQGIEEICGIEGSLPEND